VWTAKTVLVVIVLTRAVLMSQGNRAMQRVFSCTQWLLGLLFDSIDCYLLQVRKGQGRYSTGLTDMRLNIGLIFSARWRMFWTRVHNDLSRSSKVVNFGSNRKSVWDFLLVLSSRPNLGPILPRFRDIRAFVLRKPLFSRTHSYITTKISGVFPLE